MNWLPLRLRLLREGGYPGVYAQTLIDGHRPCYLFGIDSHGISFLTGTRMPRLVRCRTDGITPVHWVTGELVPFPIIQGDAGWCNSSEDYSLKWMLYRGTAILRVVRRDGSIPFNGNLVAITQERKIHVLKSAAWSAIGVPTLLGTEIPVIV